MDLTKVLSSCDRNWRTWMPPSKAWSCVSKTGRAAAGHQRGRQMPAARRTRQCRRQPRRTAGIALHSAGQTSPSTLPVRAATPTGNPPREVNIADAGYAAGIADLGAEFFVPLEELYPCDPGELSGAKLFLCDGGK